MRNTVTIMCALACLSGPIVLHALDDNALYQWQSKDGTPTYSPDPPPPGIDYVVVDSDLKPLPVQPPRPETTAATAAATPATPAPAAIPAPPGKKSIPKWKPIRYAADPTLPSKKRVTNTDGTAASAEQPVASLSTSPQSEECQLLRRETQILESYFAEAESAAEMDRAILKLQEKTNVLRQRCG
jgi:hypothetical protein